MRLVKASIDVPKRNVLVFSGWYSQTDEQDERHELFGDGLIRSPSFHSIWFEAVKKFLKPDLVLITDSNSPRKSPLGGSSEITWINLPYNPGHSTSTQHFFAGYTVAVINGLSWAIANDYRYAVYVEQDTLIFGEKLLETAISDCKNGIAFGHRGSSPQAIQQSFMVFEKQVISRFLHRLLKINFPDYLLSPEDKFALAASRFPISFVNFIRRPRFAHIISKLISSHPSFGLLSVGPGRNRPLDLSLESFYFQCGTANEVEQFIHLLASRKSEHSSDV